MFHFRFSSVTIFIGIFLFLSGCTKPGEVSIDSLSFRDEISPTDRLVFTFTDDLVGDSLLNRWVDEPYIKIEPSVEGRFRWIGKNQLEFLPFAAFPTSTSFQATLTESLIKHIPDQDNYSIDRKKVIEFQTPYLKLTAVQPIWKKNPVAGGAPVLRLVVVFNESVQSQPEKIRVTADGIAISVQPTGSDSENEMSFLIQSKDVENRNNIEVVVSEGFGNKAGTFSLKETQSISVNVPEKKKISVLSVDPVVAGSDLTISVKTNQEIENKSLENLVKISPQIRYSIRRETDGFTILAPFEYNRDYAVTISGQISGPFGSLGETYEQSVSFGVPRPSIKRLAPKAVYMSHAGEKSIGLEITGINKISVTTRKVFANNLKRFLETVRSGYWDYETDSYVRDTYQFRWSFYDEEYGSELSRESIPVSALPSSNGKFFLDFKTPEFDSFKGLYLVEVAGEFESNVQERFAVSYSDIGLISKEDVYGNITVFANSIKTTKPLSGITITLISHNNQEMATVKTGSDGIAKFKAVQNNPYRFRPEMIVGESSEGDFTFMVPRYSRVDLSRFDIGGFTENANGLLGFIYPERNLYRPGETVNFAVIVRDKAWKPVKNTTFRMDIVVPTGGKLTSVKKETDAEGTFSASFDTDVSSPTGRYVIEMYSPDLTLINSYSLNVEEFIPDRIDVKTEIDKKVLKPGDKVQVTGKAINYFGPPAANRNFETELSYEAKEIRSKIFKNFEFTIDHEVKLSFKEELVQGKTGENGEFESTFTIPDEYNNLGLVDARFFTTVFDENGRPVNRMNTLRLETQPYFLGIERVDRFVKTGDPLKVQIVAVNADGNPVTTATARLKIVRLVWETVFAENDYGDRRWVTKRREVPVSERTITLGDKGYSDSFIPESGGTYEYQLYIPGARSAVKYDFYSYRWGYTESNSFATNTEGHVDIEFDKDAYEPGDQAKIFFRTPFPGKLLVTLERDELVDHFWVETDKKAAELTIPVSEKYRPNIFVSATLFRPLDDASIPVTVAHGYQSMRVMNRKQQLPVSIKAVKESRSQTKQTITVKAGDAAGTRVTIAVVDEGILAIKDFKTPDPLEWFFRKRSLQVTSADIYGELYPEYTDRHTSVGGDKYQLAKRINPMTAKRVKLVSFWSGILETGSGGTVRFDVDIPDFSGKLRVMAVAHKGESFGHSEADITVADPVVISTSLPRFLSPGDTSSLTVTVTNTTDKTLESTIRLSTGSLLAVSGNQSTKVTIPAKGEIQPKFKLVAGPVSGVTTVTAEAETPGETFRQKFELAVRPAAGYQTVFTYGMMENSGTKTLAAPGSEWTAGTVQTKLVIGPIMGLEYMKYMQDLVGYPHGCSEQVTSRAFAMLKYAEVMKITGVRLPGAQPITEFVREAINIVFQRQNYRGGITMWPGQDETDPWISVYVAHFLSEAKRSGYQVDSHRFNLLKSFIRGLARDKQDENIFFYNYTSKNVEKKKVPSRVGIYALFVLALDGDADLSTMNFYKARGKELSHESATLLAAAYALTGDKVSFDQILPDKITGSLSEKETSYTYGSAIRNLGMSIYAVGLSDPNHSSLFTTMSLMKNIIEEEPYLNTQEMTFVLLAVSEMEKVVKQSDLTVTISQNGKETGRYNKEALFLNPAADQPIKLESKGTGKVPYILQVSGIPSNPSAYTGDNKIAVRRQYYDRQGNAITSNTFRQGDLIVVKVTIKSETQVNLNNMVITDLLPAGFEIENPRLTGASKLSWMPDADTPDYLDIRDDRISYYFQLLNYRPMTFFYQVRAVSPGNFVVGGISGEAMYNPVIRSVNKADRVIIR